MPDLPNDLAEQVRRALDEDVGGGDLTAALVPAAQTAHATILTRDDAVLCGRPWVEQVFHQLDPGIAVSWHVDEGVGVAAGSTPCELRGPARPLLTGERRAEQIS